MDEYENHPTQKPTALLDRIIKASSNPGDLALDPFSGTFTTSAVAQALGRESIGIEAEEAYVKIGLRRLEIQATYNGELLRREPKTYERQDSPAQQHLAIFERRSQWNTNLRQ
jgi:site-specific DNA-methyltransferase (adenine-specific)